MDGLCLWQALPSSNPKVLLPELTHLVWELGSWLGQIQNLSTERLLGFPHTVLPQQYPKTLCTMR